MKTRDLLTRSWQSQANISLFLIALIITVFVLPAIGFEREHVPLYENVIATGLLIFGSAIAWQNRPLFSAAIIMSIAAITARWLAWWAPTPKLALLSQVAELMSVSMIMLVLLWQVFRSGPVTSSRIQAAIALYLGLAFGWGHAYHIAALLDPGAFRIVASDLAGSVNWIAYSFGMLTTSGYEGVVPVHSVAHALSSSEAVTGQLYLTVLVARLVSMQVSAARNNFEASPKTDSFSQQQE
jgi:hypothetical protein